MILVKGNNVLGVSTLGKKLLQLARLVETLKLRVATNTSTINKHPWYCWGTRHCTKEILYTAAILSLIKFYNSWIHPYILAQLFASPTIRTMCLWKYDHTVTVDLRVHKLSLRTVRIYIRTTIAHIQLSIYSLEWSKMTVWFDSSVGIRSSL